MVFNDRSTEDADRYLFLGLVLALIWVPLPVGSNHLWAWSFFEVCIFALSISWLVLYAMGSVRTTLQFRRAWPALLLFALLFVLVILQVAPLPSSLISLLSPNSAEVYSHTQTDPTLSLDPSATRSAALKTLTYGLLFALTLLLINGRDRLYILAMVLIFSGVVQAVFGTFMTLSGLEFGFFVEKLHNRGVVTGTFVNPNHLAGYLQMCLALGVGLMLTGMSAAPADNWRESARRVLGALLGSKGRVRVALIIMAIGLVLSQSRIGNIAFFTSLLFAGGYYVVVSRRVRTSTIAFFVGVLLIDILIIGNFFELEKVTDEVRQTSAITEVARIDVGRDTMNIVRDYPLTGTGAGSFASTYPMYDSGKVGSRYYKHAHNDYLQFASEFGLLGLAMLAWIVLLSLWNSARAQVIRHQQMMRGLSCGVLMAVVAILIHSAFDFNLQIPANAATFVVILAMGWQTRWLGCRAHARNQSTGTLGDETSAEGDDRD